MSNNDIQLEDDLSHGCIFEYESNHSSTQVKDESKTKNKFVSKRKRVKKDKQVLLRKKKRLIRISPLISTCDAIILFNGLIIQSDGVLRFSLSVNQQSFGFNILNVHSVTYSKSHELFTVVKSSPPQTKKLTLESALIFLARTPCKMHEEASSALKTFFEKNKNLYESIQQVKINANGKRQKEQEMSIFVEKSLKYIHAYSDKHGGEIFSYGIGRLDVSQKDFDVNVIGHSKSFLDLIGIDIDNFSAIYLRQQKVDLVSDSDEILRSSIYGLNQCIYNGTFPQLTYNIVTFDGFPLKIKTYRKFHFPPDFHYNQLVEIPCEYFLQITSVDIDLQELQNLIHYRENLLKKSNQLSFDDYIKKELSYLFEKVEYSVHSEAFIEKYYRENIDNLHLLKQNKLQHETIVNCE